MQNGARLNIADKQGRSALHLLASISVRDAPPELSAHWVLETIYKTCGDPKNPFFSPSESPLMAQDTAGNTPLILAAEQNNLGIFGVLLQYEHESRNTRIVNICNTVGDTALHKAAVNDHQEQLATDDEFKYDSMEGEQLKRYYSDVLSALLQSPEEMLEVNPQNKNKDTPLHLAIRYAKWRNVSVILGVMCARNISLTHCKNNVGNTALHEMVIAKAPEMFKQVLAEAKGLIEPDKKNRQGDTALKMAIQARTAETLDIAAQLIIVAGANLNCKDIHGQTALHQAVGFHGTEALELLLEQRGYIQLSVQDKCGMTALMIAAKQGRKRAVNLLLKHCDHTEKLSITLEDIELKNNANLIAMNVAFSEEEFDIGGIISKHHNKLKGFQVRIKNPAGEENRRLVQTERPHEMRLLKCSVSKKNHRAQQQAESKEFAPASAPPCNPYTLYKSVSDSGNGNLDEGLSHPEPPNNTNNTMYA